MSERPVCNNKDMVLYNPCIYLLYSAVLHGSLLAVLMCFIAFCQWFNKWIFFYSSSPRLPFQPSE